MSSLFNTQKGSFREVKDFDDKLPSAPVDVLFYIKFYFMFFAMLSIMFLTYVSIFSKLFIIITISASSDIITKQLFFS